MLFNFVLYFTFGVLLSGREKRLSFSGAVLSGFFFYYLLFDLFCLPIMLNYRPLSLLTSIWIPFVCVIMVVAVVVRRKGILSMLRSLRETGERHPYFFFFLFLITGIQVALVVAAYQFTFDAAYYVANVTTSITTDMMNIYDPFTGDWQDHFEMRYLFATYPMNDAVLCQFTGIHPLVWTKTVMTGTAVILCNVVYYKIGRLLFEGQGALGASGETRGKVLLFLLIVGLINFFFTSIYTASAFLTTRSYEGKSLLGNVVVPAIFYLYLKMLKRGESVRDWLALGLICLSSTALSNSANMLVPATVGIFFLSLSLVRRKPLIFMRAILCTVPCLCLMVAYVLYVRGAFVIYTYPR